LFAIDLKLRVGGRIVALEGFLDVMLAGVLNAVKAEIQQR
jgi:hypothetical protein